MKMKMKMKTRMVTRPKIWRGMCGYELGYGLIVGCQSGQVVRLAHWASLDIGLVPLVGRIINSIKSPHELN